MISHQFFQAVLYVALVFFAISQGIELLNQMTLIPLKHRKAIVALKSKLSLISIGIKYDKLSYVAIYLAEWIIIPSLLLLGIYNGPTSQSIWIICIGALIMCFGEGLRLWATYTLGKFFTFVVVITKDHGLLKSGPYKYVRHPAYLGGLIIAVGTGILSGLWFAPIIAVALICAAYAYRIRVEEAALREKFKASYPKYSQNTAMLVPHVL